MQQIICMFLFIVFGHHLLFFDDQHIRYGFFFQNCLQQILIHFNSMSRCEHGEVISLYCINEACTWKETGGCQNCFKRYHFHSTTQGTITNDQLDELYRKMIIRPDPKAKSRILQEAVYNYFGTMKSQLSNSIDAISRELTNRLNFPYLYEAKQYDTFNKIKNKEFKKLTKKEVKSFYEFASQSTKEELEQKERHIYSEEVTTLKAVITKINEAFCLYSEAVADLEHTFQVDQTLPNKIQEIASSAETLLKLGNTSTGDGSDIGNRSQGNRSQGNPTEMQHLLKPPLPPSRDRKISVDLNRETQRKKDLDYPTYNYGMGMDSIKVDLAKESQKRVIERSAQKHFQREFSKSPSTEGRRLVDSEKDNIRSDFVHTTLPRETSKPKLYEYSTELKQKKITVPVKLQEESAECSSPLLKKKKTMSQNSPGKSTNKNGFTLFKVESKSEEERQMEKQQAVQQAEQNKQLASVQQQKQQQEEILQSKQAQSLALLVSSLSKSAQEAIPFLEASLKHASNNLSAAEYLSYLYLEVGKPKQCLSVCNQILEQIENSPQCSQLGEHIINNKAAAYNMLGRYSESISILEKELAKKQKDIYYKNLGDAYFSIGISEKAVVSYEKAVRLNPEMDEAHFNLGVCFYMQGNFTQAKLSIQKALKINYTNECYKELNNEINKKLPI